MSTMKLTWILLMSTLAAAQCSTTAPSTCVSPLMIVNPNPTTQSGITLVDNGLPAPPPVAKQYLLSIVNGTIQESDNGGAYHTLTGPQGLPGTAGVKGDKGDPGAAGIPGNNGRDGVAATITMGTVVPGPVPAVTNSGTPTNAVLNFVLTPGVQGPQGIPGADSFAIGSSMTVTVTNCNIIGVGRTCVLKRIK
jgi:hypothetical protein